MLRVSVRAPSRPNMAARNSRLCRSRTMATTQSRSVSQRFRYFANDKRRRPEREDSTVLGDSGGLQYFFVSPLKVTMNEGLDVFPETRRRQYREDVVTRVVEEFCHIPCLVS